MSAPTQSLAQLDVRLAEVRRVVERMGSDLLTFDANPVRQILDTSSLSGVSAAAWAGSGPRLGHLWQGYTRLSELLREATDLRGAKRKLSDTDRAELAHLLLSRAVADPALLDPADPSGPPGFTADPNDPRLRTVDEVVAWLSATFEPLADVVARAGTVWEEVVPRLSDLDAVLDASESDGCTAGVRIPNEMAVARRQLRDVRDRAVADPLSVDSGQVDAAAATVERARASVLGAVRADGEMDGVLLEAGADLDAVGDLLSAAGTAAAQSQLAVARWRGPSDELRRARDTLAALRSEMQDLTGSAGEAPLREGAGRRVGALRRRSAALVEEANKLAEACRSGLEVRAELRGRLQAYRARAAASGRGEDLELDGLFHQAENILYAAPCDLQEAGRLVTHYQEAVRRSSGPQSR